MNGAKPNHPTYGPGQDGTGWGGLMQLPFNSGKTNLTKYQDIHYINGKNNIIIIYDDAVLILWQHFPKIKAGKQIPDPNQYICLFHRR
jgi:hypothetical protein